MPEFKIFKETNPNKSFVEFCEVAALSVLCPSINEIGIAIHRNTQKLKFIGLTDDEAEMV